MSEADAWAWLARAVGADASPESRMPLGAISLLPHQQQALDRLGPLLDTHRVALLADDTGLGKTYVACALASRAVAPVIVAPAALRAPWQSALEDTAVRATVVSHEALSRDRRWEVAPDLVVIDEAHHARTPTTHRWRRLAELCRSARVLLLSATPIHNRPRDLGALFALVLGPEVIGWPVARLQHLVVRRDTRVLLEAPSMASPPRAMHMPRLTPWTWHPVPSDASIGRRLVALPPALPAADGTEAAPLWRLALLRAWASSTAALAAAVRRRIARGLALAQGLASDRWLTRATLARWTCDDAATPELALDPSPPDDTPPPERLAAWRETVEAHVGALRSLLPSLAADGADAARAALVARTLDAARPARAVLFCTEIATARAYWLHLRHRPGTALATGRGGRIASGPIDRATLFAALDREGPARHHAREQVHLLIATDVASEGLNLSAASVVWHADLPWTPARIAQRIGRVARLASPHESVAIHAFDPPPAAEARLGLQQRLDAKAATAAPLGTHGPWPPRQRPAAADRAAWADAATPMSTADAAWALGRLAREHGTPATGAPTCGAPTCGAPTSGAPATGAPATIVRWAPRSAIVTVVRRADGLHLRTLADDAPPEHSPTAAWRAMAGVDWHGPAPPPRARATALRAATRRLTTDARRQHTTRAVAGDRGAGSDMRHLLARLARELRAVPAHRRAESAGVAAAWRRRLATPVPAGWREVLLALATSGAPGADWWRDASAALARLPPPGVPPDRDEVVARFVLVATPRRR